MKRLGHVFGLNLHRGEFEGPGITIDGHEFPYAQNIVLDADPETDRIKVTVSFTAAYVGGLEAAQKYLREREEEEAERPSYFPRHLEGLFEENTRSMEET